MICKAFTEHLKEKGKLTSIPEQRQIRQLGDEVGGALFPDPFDGYEPRT